MKSRRLWSFLLALVMVVTVLPFSSKIAKAESEKKYLRVNEVTMGFEEVIYVDGTIGDDENGDGSKGSPFTTVVKAFDYMTENCKEGGAIVISDGTYDVAELFKGSSNNINARYNGLKISVFARTMGGVELMNAQEWMIVENNNKFRIKINMYGIRIATTNLYYHLGGDDWQNEFYNCVFPAGYGGLAYHVSSAKVKVENSVFIGAPYMGSNFYSKYPIRGTAVNCASNTQYMDVNGGTRTSSLFNATFDPDYNITSTGWENTGTGTNPDGSQAHIGVYGGQFSWGSVVEEVSSASGNQLDMVLEVGEKLLLSVDDHLSENINMNWISSDDSVATIDANGMVTALKTGETTIQVISKNGKYTDTINILVIEDADDYRLAVDLNVGESCRATVDKNKHLAKVTWSAADESVATVSSKGKITAQGKGLTIVKATDEDGNEVGMVYVRVR